MLRERILGAIIAGGQSRRFGSDKALAPINGQPMIAHVIAALRPQVDALVICGREWGDIPFLHDRRPDRCGPLAGLEAALHHAQDCGYDAVISVPVDTLPLPKDLRARLAGNGPAVLEHQTLIGYWPVSCLASLSDQLATAELGVHAWLAHSSTRRVSEPFQITNINRPIDILGYLSAAQFF